LSLKIGVLMEFNYSSNFKGSYLKFYTHRPEKMKFVEKKFILRFWDFTMN